MTGSNCDAARNETGRSSPRPRRHKLVSVELHDWRSDHRALALEERGAVHDYICAILRCDLLVRDAGHDDQQREADRLWRRFRDAYDALAHADREDFRRAMSRI